jgi:hypothetical protein
VAAWATLGDTGSDGAAGWDNEYDSLMEASPVSARAAC